MDSSVFRRELAGSWSEAFFQSEVIRLAKALGWVYYHTHDSRRSPAGFPDLVLMHRGQGRVIYRELKTERGRVTAAQRDWQDGLVLCGVDAAVWRPSDWLSGRVKSELLKG